MYPIKIAPLEIACFVPPATFAVDQPSNRTKGAPNVGRR